MKSILTITMILLFCSATAIAQNPDSRPSLTFGLEGASGDAENEISGVNVQNADIGQFHISGSLRWPMNENTAIAFGGAYSKSNSEWNESIYYLGSKVKSSGFALGLSFTFYFGESVNK